MKNHSLNSLLMILLILLSCSEPLELNGEWLIMKMEHNNEYVYPDIPQKLMMRTPGYHQFASFSFEENKNAILLPGFNCEELYLKYDFSQDSIEIYLHNSLFNNFKTHGIDYQKKKYDLGELFDEDTLFFNKIDSLDSIKSNILLTRGSEAVQYKNSLEIYCGKYGVSTNSNHSQIVLSSNKTKILLLNNMYLFDIQIDKMFKGLNKNLPKPLLPF